MTTTMINGDQVHRSVNHYSPHQEILLVGEGDFSFSLSLALIFGSASNIVATSLDCKYELIKKYKNAEFNVAQLKLMGGQVYHGVDATKMSCYSDLRMRKFDCIIFNFPHAGFHGREHSPRMIREHSKLVHGFFKNAASMLRPYGEVHVSHKTTEPYSHWNLKDLASTCSLALRECVDFNKEDYPWYNNKRGDGKTPDIPFNLGKCSTFKFTFAHYDEFTRMAVNHRHQNGIPIRRYQLGDAAVVQCHNQLPLNHPFSTQDRGTIIPEAAAAFMVPPRNLNQPHPSDEAVQCHNQLPLAAYGGHLNHPVSAQDRGTIVPRAGIVPEAAAAAALMVPPRSLNQPHPFGRSMVPTTFYQQHLGSEDQQADSLRSLWLLLVSLHGQHPQAAARLYDGNASYCLP
ncbi:Heavy metal-associated isoprenylated plant protein 41 [Linum grandiflorum]